MKKTKIIAMYLPQYHRIPENDKWWGEGFTDWEAAKKASPLFEGHEQPKIPCDEFYYDLSRKEDISWQVKLANKYGIDGLCIYHYWFSSKLQLLEKPAEIIRDNADIEIPFCFAWDNTSWIRTWSKIRGNAWSTQSRGDKVEEENEGVLAKLDYGNKKDWEIHFNYLLTFFKDERYIKKEGKPIFIFFTNTELETLKSMGEYWNELAKKNGFPGIYLITRVSPLNKKRIFDGTLCYEPVYSGWQTGMIIKKMLRTTNVKKQDKIQKYSYDKIWGKIVKSAKFCKKEYQYYGAFVGYDDTPRRGKKGKVVCGNTPEKFAKYLKRLREICEEQNKEWLFLTAWNEWGEGAILEPDEQNGRAYLEMISRVQGE